jgi:very-short-patch-repair endonuclease
MTKLYNQSSERDKRRSLRNNMPLAEKIVWAKIRSQQIEKCRFRRQYSISAFVIDFYAPELKLALEIDGNSHFVEGAQAYDVRIQVSGVGMRAGIIRSSAHEVAINAC